MTPAEAYRRGVQASREHQASTPPDDIPEGVKPAWRAGWCDSYNLGNNDPCDPFDAGFADVMQTEPITCYRCKDTGKCLGEKCPFALYPKGTE